MSEEYATKKDMQEFTATILDAMNTMFDTLSAKIEESSQRTEDRIMARIEAGLGKQVQASTERIDVLCEQMDALEGHMAHMTERVESIDLRLTAVEMDMKDVKRQLKTLEEGQQEIKEAVTRHDDEIITLRRVK